MDEQSSGFVAIIPAAIIEDTEISASTKILFGLLTLLTKKEGFCWATNSYIAERMNVGTRTVQRMVGQLAERGYIRVDVIRDAETNEVKRRHIYCYLNPAAVRTSQEENDPSCQDCRDPSRQKCRDPSCQDCHDLTTEMSRYYKITRKEEQEKNGNTPKAPSRGRRAAKKVPDHEPEMFNRFWMAYPRKEDKQGAIAEWDKLKPDMELIREMLTALERQMATEDWQRRIGIPYAVRWLRRRRWEDEVYVPSKTTAGPSPTRVVDMQEVDEW